MRMVSGLQGPSPPSRSSGVMGGVMGACPPFLLSYYVCDFSDIHQKVGVHRYHAINRKHECHHVKRRIIFRIPLRENMSACPPFCPVPHFVPHFHFHILLTPYSPPLFILSPQNVSSPNGSSPMFVKKY